MNNDAVFHRDLGHEYPRIARAQGSYLYTEDGTQYFDGSSGAVAANLGHGVTEIAQAMYQQALAVGFAHTLRFETDALHDAASRIVELAPAGFSRVFFASGGAEANESALKLARQYHLTRGEAGRHLVVGFWDNYHGNTLGALAVGGDSSRRHQYAPMLPRTLRLPGWRDGDGVTPVSALNRLIRSEGAENISALILEPFVGSQLGAFEPPHESLQQIAELCREHHIVLIADEIMTGFGRCGTHFASERSAFTPDLITFGKGVTGGYAPLSGVLVTETIVQAIRERGGIFHHGFTYSGHPVSAAAAAAALKLYTERQVCENVQRQGKRLARELRRLAADVPTLINEVRGDGLLLGIEFIPDLEAAGGSHYVNRVAMSHGLVLYPGSSTRADAAGMPRNFPHVLVAPPLTITDEETTDLFARLHATLTSIT